MKIIPFLLTSVLFLSGCTTPPLKYYYGKYSTTLYRTKKDGTPGSLENHKNSLVKIIQTSKERGYRVPPGIYCEYAYLLSNEGNPEAEKYFALEIETYPESERFVGLIRNQIKQSPSK